MTARWEPMGWLIHGRVPWGTIAGLPAKTTMRRATVEQAERPIPVAEDEAAAGERYLLLADISGYTGFMGGVEVAHGVDFSDGIPAAYSILAALLDAVIAGIEPDFSVVKLEGDAVFAAAPAKRLDAHGTRVLETLGATYQGFVESRTRAIPTSDHVCIACPNVVNLDLKFVLHRGPVVRQSVDRAATSSDPR